MNISKAFLDKLKQHEKLMLKAYMPTKNDVWTIGYGHTKGVTEGMTITEAEAEAFLRSDLEWAEKAVSRNVSVALNQYQFDALVSFVFNIGESNFKKSTLLRELNNGNYEAAAQQFKRWNKQKGKVLKGLTIRRAQEAEHFSTPIRTKVTQSTTVQASTVQLIGGAGTAIGAVSSLQGTAQIVALGLAALIVVTAAWIMRERIKKWSRGIK